MHSVYKLAKWKRGLFVVAVEQVLLSYNVLREIAKQLLALGVASIACK